MPCPHYALAAFVLLALPAAVCGQTALQPQDGLLVLRNGQVLAGQITQAGDYYVVTLGGASEIRLKTSEVEAVCGSLDEAYDFKARHLSGAGARRTWTWLNGACGTNCTPAADSSSWRQCASSPTIPR